MNRLTAQLRTPRGVPVVAGVAAVTAVLEAGGLVLGWWWATVVVAAVVTIACRGRRVLLAIVAGTLVAWAALALWSSAGRLGALADLVGALAFDERGMAWVVITVTALYAVVLALAGAWAGGALRRQFLRAQPDAATAGSSADAGRLAIGPVDGDTALEAERV